MLPCQPQVGGPTRLQGSRGSLKDTELVLKITVLVSPFLSTWDPVDRRVTPESQNLYSLPLPGCSPH